MSIEFIYFIIAVSVIIIIGIIIIFFKIKILKLKNRQSLKIKNIIHNFNIEIKHEKSFYYEECQKTNELNYDCMILKKEIKKINKKILEYKQQIFNLSMKSMRLNNKNNIYKSKLGINIINKTPKNEKEKFQRIYKKLYCAICNGQNQSKYIYTIYSYCIKTDICKYTKKRYQYKSLDFEIIDEALYQKLFNKLVAEAYRLKTTVKQSCISDYIVTLKPTLKKRNLDFEKIVLN